MEENKNTMEMENKLDAEQGTEEPVIEEKGIVKKAVEFAAKNKVAIALGVVTIGAIVLGKSLIKDDSVVQDVIDTVDASELVEEFVSDMVEPK